MFNPLNLFSKLIKSHNQKELDRLGKLDISNAIINLHKKKYLVKSKKKIIKFLDTNYVPLIYLEEALEKQKKGHIKYEIGDRVRYKRKDNIYIYGIISDISNKGYQVHYAEHRSYLNEDGIYEFYPNFMKISYTPHNKLISGWDLEFLGKENEASKRLRQKLEKDKEISEDEKRSFEIDIQKLTDEFTDDTVIDDC